MVFYILYYLFVAEGPLWEAIMTDSILMLVNIVMIVIIALERTTVSMNSDRTMVEQWDLNNVHCVTINVIV